MVGNIRSCVVSQIVDRAEFVISTLPLDKGLARDVYYHWISNQLSSCSTKMRVCTASKLWTLFFKLRGKSA